MQLEIREARPDDADAIVRILNPIIAAGVYTVFDTPFTPESEREYILNLLATSGGRSLSYAVLRSASSAGNQRCEGTSAS